jgi:hypothetical protein
MGRQEVLYAVLSSSCEEKKMYGKGFYADLLTGKYNFESQFKRVH